MQAFIVSPWTALVVGCIAAFMGAHYAGQRGRRPDIWFTIGLLFGLPGLMVLFMLPIVKPAQAESSEPEQAKPVEFEIRDAVPDPRYQEWFYLDTSRCQVGPVSFRELFSVWRDQLIDAESYVWTEGMPEWEPIRQIPALLEKLR